MSHFTESFPTDLLLRRSKPIALQHKNSLEYKPRNHSLRTKEKSIQSSSKIQYEVYSPIIPMKSKPLENTFKSQHQYNLFADQCLDFLGKKKGAVQKGGQNLKTMFRNIREQLKQVEKKSRNQKQHKNKIDRNEGFLVMRSKIHQHFYHAQDKMEFYRITRAAENSTQFVSSKTRYAMNPFDKVSMSCETAQISPSKKDPHKRGEKVFLRQSTIQSRSSSRRVVAVVRNNMARSMSFHLAGDYDSTYPKKLKSFLDFIFKVNYSNGIYVDLSFSKQYDATPRYKIYIGKGNNSLLIKSIVKRRFWWQMTSNINQNGIDFYWSQNLISKVHDIQTNADKRNKKQSRNCFKRTKDMEQMYELNKKIMGEEQAISVEKFILSDGYGLPFSDFYQPEVMTNHLPFNNSIGTKKNLFKSLFHYHSNHTHKPPFAYIPKSYHIKSSDDSQFTRFKQQNKTNKNNMWIVKPGENTNRGRDIKVADFNAVGSLIVKGKHHNGQALTYIVQEYIARPLLYHGRKFDIRHYMLVTSVNGRMKGYWYKDGYLRTSSFPFDLSADNMYVHLTNDAIQKKCDSYQKHQPGNKVSYSQFQRYLDYAYSGKLNFEKDVMGKMKEIGIDILTANYNVLDGNRLKNNFQLLGLDFMIDKDFKTWLIEVNYNPCLEVNCPVLERIVPALMENTFRLGLDPLFPPTSHYPTHQRYYLVDNYLKNCKYELIFDDFLIDPIQNDYPFEDEKEEGEEYQDQGKEVTDLGL